MILGKVLTTLSLFFSAHPLYAHTRELRVREIANTATACHARINALEEALSAYTNVEYTFCEKKPYSSAFNGLIALPENHKVRQKRLQSTDIWQAYPSEQACNDNLGHEIELFKLATGLNEVLLAYCYRTSSLNSLKWNTNIISNGQSNIHHYLTQLSFDGRVEADRDEIQQRVADAFQTKGINLTSFHAGQGMFGPVIVAGYYKNGMKMHLNNNAVGEIGSLHHCTLEKQRWEEAFLAHGALSVYCVLKPSSTFELHVLTLDENAMEARSFRRLFTGAMYGSRQECEANIVATRGFAQICARDVFLKQWGIHYFLAR
jgi:hypothetical protein